MFKPKNRLKEPEQEVQEVDEVEEDVLPELPPLKQEAPKKAPQVQDYSLQEVPTQTSIMIIDRRKNEAIDMQTAMVEILNILRKFEREFDKQ